jgi:hypothetical protein
MKPAEQSIVIDCPIGDVFAFVADQRNTPQWQAGLVEVQRLTDGPSGVGTRHAFIRKFLGRRMVGRNEFIAYETNRRVTFRTTSGPPLEASYLFEPVGEGTRLTSRVQFQSSGLGRLLEPVMAAGLRREMKSAFPALKALLEDRPR